MSVSKSGMARVETIARLAQYATMAGLAVIATLFVWLVFQAIFNGSSADWFLLSQFEKTFELERFTVSQRIALIGFFWGTEMFGVAALFASFKLFAGYRRGEIFTARAAKRLRLVGWLLVLLAPVSTLFETLAVGYLARIANPAKVIVDVSLDDGDIYAIVFGLLIVVVGHIMYEAVKLFDENKSFV